jgi:predicted TIM-barrel fold metal-dependent hydrolase
MLSIAGWGWHAETALHTLRLISSGIFDRFPTLQLMIGHMGEMLPMALVRTSQALSHVAKLRQPVAAYFRSNIHLTTSGYFTRPPLQCALDVVGIDRLMFSIDYPFSSTTKGSDYLAEIEQFLSPEDLAKLTHRNAEAPLSL